MLSYVLIILLTRVIRKKWTYYTYIYVYMCVYDCIERYYINAIAHLRVPRGHTQVYNVLFRIIVKVYFFQEIDPVYIDKTMLWIIGTSRGGIRLFIGKQCLYLPKPVNFGLLQGSIHNSYLMGWLIKISFFRLLNFQYMCVIFFLFIYLVKKTL